MYNKQVRIKKTIEIIKKNNKWRKDMGMAEIKYGEIPCITCGKIFFSADIRGQRMCVAHRHLKADHVVGKISS